MDCSPAEVGRRLKTLHGTEARAIRAQVLSALRTVVGMDFSLFYSLADVDGKTHLSEWQADGDDGLVDRIMSPLARSPWPGETFLNLQTPEPRSTRSSWNGPPWGRARRSSRAPSSAGSTRRTA